MPSPIRRYAFRRNLPHLQKDATLFVSMSTYKRWELPPRARDIVFVVASYLDYPWRWINPERPD